MNKIYDVSLAGLECLPGIFMFNFILTLDNKCHFATVGRRRGIYFFILSKEESVMKQDGNIAWNQKILNAIPKDVLDDVPEHKTDEFRRGVLLYLSKETPELYQKAENAGELSEELCQQLAQQIRKFAELVKAKKRNGGMKNA